ncbi:PH domain-containing protein [Microbacterium amylolyticum]|uniref:Membrane protein YdbS with pleckstrin-like domain n=1 Tax=Microbacterium amylolyticum TaxID=936337 RepID=A0ABS4ZGI7_9MICO|nr:PH domain-containing protein [Microbacterium amylolyticum]MBP2436386.1 membrane protein YdbS with pleckstrin-like domain [Microbacterium amylolyticum]
MSDSQTPNPEQNPSSEPHTAPATPPVSAPDTPNVTAAHPPIPDEAPAVTEAEFPPEREAVTPPEVLDNGTYTQIREPKKPGLKLDGAWHQISPKYVVTQYIQAGAWLVFVAAVAIAVHIFFEQWWTWPVAGVLVIGQLIEMIILPRQAKALGYMLRGDDIVFRKGILWQRVVAVPYGRMQLIDITHGPMDRAFGIAKLKMVTAAASTGVEIPGLSQGAAEALRDTLIHVAETRRTGL